MSIDGALALWDAPQPGDIGASVEEMLARLAGPTVIRVPGVDRTRCRIVVTLLHGNEPSGLRAMHAWLRGAPRPRVDAVLIVAAVPAARLSPLFSQRLLPGGADLNRCFLPPFRGAGGALAAAILDVIEGARAEALIDLHNNTGHNPPYAIVTRIDPKRLALTALFAERLVLSDLRLGALMEAVEERLPSITVECGRVGDPRADAVARRGIDRFFALERIVPAGASDPLPMILESPLPVRVRTGVRLAVGAGARPDADLTIAENLDRHNFEELAAGTSLGWVGDTAEWPITAVDSTGRDCADELFLMEGGELRARRPWIPIMMTTDPAIAAQDCLFYVVRRQAA